MIKQIITALILGTSSLPAIAQTQFRITGSVPGMSQKCNVVLKNEEGQEATKIAQTTVKADGTFILTGEMERSPRMCSLNFWLPTGTTFDDGTPRYRSLAKVRLMVDASPITFAADTTTLFDGKLYSWDKEAKVNISGGEATRQYVEFLTYTREAEAVATKASYREAEAYFDNNGDKTKYPNEIAEKERTARIQHETEDAFLKAHPNYYATAAVIAQRVYKSFTYTRPEMQAYIDLVRESPDTMHTNFLRRNYDLILSQCLGTPYTDFVGKQKDNTEVRLSSLMKEGKYTLIDFWASWCGPCRAAIPKVKAMAEDYKDKLQVISVSVDEKEDAWRKAEAQEAMPWPQLILEKEGYNTAVNAYTIQSIPRLVLIDPQGQIVIITHSPDEILKVLADEP